MEFHSIKYLQSSEIKFLIKDLSNERNKFNFNGHKLHQYLNIRIRFSEIKEKENNLFY